MIKTITRKVTKEVEETVSSVGICDICGKEFNYETGFNNEKRARYFHIVTGHYDWGNDSCDSIEDNDACCIECLSKFMQEWLKSEDIINSDTAYIKVDKSKHIFKEVEK